MKAAKHGVGVVGFAVGNGISFWMACTLSGIEKQPFYLISQVQVSIFLKQEAVGIQ